MAGNSQSTAPPASDDGEDNMLFEVKPLLTCPHLGAVKPFTRFEVNINQECPHCTTEEDKRKKENWICLTCHSVNCSRYVQNHAIEHFYSNPEHAMAISTADLSVWCYVCESYVHNERLLSAKNELHLEKFNIPIPG